MRFTRYLIGSPALILLTLIPTSDADACSCMSSGPPCQNYFQVDAVFTGRVERISPAPDGDPPVRKVRVEFAVAAAFRGIQGSTVSILTADSGAACGYAFKPGERYLVYAYRTKDGARLEASICSRTRLLAGAGDDLRFLETLSTPAAAGARVFGSIRHREPDLATGLPRDYGPVADVLVTVRGPASAFEAWTDGQGRYEVTGLPPGTYEIAVLPPADFSIRHLQQTADLPDARACFVADFGVRYDGRITGVVRNTSGEPAEGAQVEVMAVERVGATGNIEALRTRTGAGGSFEFADVPPGRYVVGVDLTRRMDPKLVFPATFHPGTPDPALATVVQLDRGNRHDLESMTLPPARRTYQLTGTVTFEDGAPVSGASISLWDGAATWRQVAVGIKTEIDGTFSFVVHEGLSYVAKASYTDSSGREWKRLGGRVGPFVMSEHTGPLKVVLLPTR
jgi:hypothetical protein